MKTYIADIIPKIQQFSQKLDNLTLLTNQHWVVVDEITNSKTVYIFRKKNDLIISCNGRVEKARWEYLDRNTLLLECKEGSYLYRHGFFDENLLALKLDGRDEYALLINESKYGKDLNSYKRVLEYLERKYIQLPMSQDSPANLPRAPLPKIKSKFKTDKGIIVIEHQDGFQPFTGDKAYFGENPAPDGVYKLGFMWYAHIKDGKVEFCSEFKKKSPSN